MTRQQVRLWERVWELVAEPRSVTLITLSGYAACVIVGIYALLIPDITGVRDLVGALFLLGGLIAGLGCPFGQWWIERIGLIGLGFAAVMRAVIVLEYGRPDASFALLTLWLVLILIITRWIRIRTLPVDPRRPPTLWELRRGGR